MKGFFFDENLPTRIQFKPSLPLVSDQDLGSSPTDTEVWEFARKRELVIVSKDADFSERIILATPPPWVVHLRFGNMRRKAFHGLLARVWPQVESLLKTHKLHSLNGSSCSIFPEQRQGLFQRRASTRRTPPVVFLPGHCHRWPRGPDSHHEQ